jgi:hypothetical protein
MEASFLSHQGNSCAVARYQLKRLGAMTAIALVFLATAANLMQAQSAEESATHPKGAVRIYPVDIHHTVPKTDGRVQVSPNAAPAGAHLTYYGGRVVSNPQIIAVFWGAGSYISNLSSATEMNNYFTYITGGSVTSWLDSEYNTVNPSGTKTNQNIGPGLYSGSYTITPSTSATTVSDTTIQSELTAQINAGHLPPPSTDAAGNTNTMYMVFFRHGMTITQGGSSSCVAGGFCAYHGTIPAGSLRELYYGVQPDMQAGSGCDTGCGNASTNWGNYTSVMSHEIMETITDAEVGIATVVGPPLAWYDATNGEIGDICNAQQGTVTGPNGAPITVQLEFSNAQRNCINLPNWSGGSTNDFSISASPAGLTIQQGSSGTSTISTTVVSGSGTVALTASGAPSGVTATLSPTSVAAGSSSTLTLNVGSAVAPGTYTITVTGTEGSATHSTPVTLTVTAVTGNDFSISASPTNLTGPGTSTISTAVTSGSAATVSLTVSVSPIGPTASVSPTSITAGQSATLTVGSAAAGTYTITVTGTEGTKVHSTSVTLTASGGGGGIVNGGFETGSFSGWTTAGASETIVASGCHGGTYCAKLGASTPTNGDSSAVQTFTAPAGTTGISLWYKMTCPDTVTYDWATVALKDNTAGTTATLLGRVCTTNAWTNITGAVTAGHSYTLTLTSHDDNYSGDPTYTLYDDVTLTSAPPPPSGITNGGFESNYTGWTTSGASETIATSGCHGGTHCAMLGGTSPTNGDSNAAQTFTIPSGKSQLSVWYKMTCPDTVTYDWATVTLKDNTAGTTATLLGKVCTTNAWTNITGAVTAGHSYTLTLTSHDDNYSADPSFTLYDDAILN